jgi:ammonium transporter, Amt family
MYFIFFHFIIFLSLERVTVYGFIVFQLVWHICIYAPVAFIMWNSEGWFATHKVEDFSGGMVVNQLAAMTIIVLTFFLDWKKAPPATNTISDDKLGILLNTLVFWFVSFGVHAGKAHAANAVAAQSVVNTIAGVFTSILFNYLFKEYKGEEFSPIAIANAIILGVIATAPCSGFVTVGGVMIIVIITILCVEVFAYVMSEGKNDSVYSFQLLYGVGGTISFLFTGMMTYFFVNPYTGNNGLTYGDPGVIRHHLAAILAMWTVAPISILICAFLCDMFVPLSRSEQASNEVFAPVSLGPFRQETVIFSPSDIYRQSTKIPMKGKYQYSQSNHQ